jgi:hypothetical protein
MPILQVKAKQSAIRGILRSISDMLYRRSQNLVDKSHVGEERPGDHVKSAPSRSNAAWQRLSETVARLERLDAAQFDD